MDAIFQSIQALDFRILDAIQDVFRCAFLDAFMPVITLLGNAGICWLILALFLLLWKSKRTCGLSILAGLLFHLLFINLFLKKVTARLRPFQVNESFPLLITAPTDYSFPSGHTGGAFIAATILLHYDKRLGIPVLILAIMIAFSRLYLYVHYPSDVIAGAIIGILLGRIAIALTEKFLNKQ